MRPQGRNSGHHNDALVNRRDHKENVRHIQYQEVWYRHEQQLEFDVDQEEERSISECFAEEIQRRGFSVVVTV